jgi:2-polyprenyl-6-methoxyphenol hydroxylase-like FAD-dependent oxidoreductase
MLLARVGHDVVVVDQASFPSDTVSTHSLARSGVVQLHRWGLLDEVLDSGAPATRQVSFNAGGESVSRTIKHKAGVDFLVAPRRYVLDTILAAAAQRAGAQLRPGVTVTGLQRDGHGRVVGWPGRTAPVPRSRSGPATSSAPTGSGRGSPSWSAPGSTRPAGGQRRPVRLLRWQPVGRL